MIHSFMEQQTRSTSHQETSTVVDIYESEESISVHSFDSVASKHARTYDYLTTNLVTGHNLTLADVITEEASHAVIHQRFEVAASKGRFRSNPFGQVDPRAELKDLKQRQPVETMVPFDKVVDLSVKAREVLLDFQNSKGRMGGVGAQVRDS